MKRWIAGLVTAGLLLGACSGGGSGAETTLELVGEDTTFVPATMSAPAGTITIEFHHRDEGVMHNVQVTGDGVDESTELVQGPVEQTLSIEAAAGTYDYICTVHPEEMVGTLVVS